MENCGMNGVYRRLNEALDLILNSLDVDKTFISIFQAELSVKKPRKKYSQITVE